MNIKRFFGKNSREALGMVRKALGEDAVILSNRAMNGGNEIMAFKEADMNNMVEREANEQEIINKHIAHQASQSHGSPNHGLQNHGLQNHGSPSQQTFNHASNFDHSEPTTLLSLLHGNRSQSAQIADHNETVKYADIKRAEIKKNANMSIQAVAEKSSSAQTPKQASNTQQSNLQMTQMLNEMRNMRSVIESQLTTISWGNIQQRDPSKSQVLSALLSAGFSAALARQLAEKMPDNRSGDQAMTWIKSILALNLNTVETDSEALDQGGVFALIGPTGVGKTTTTAKLAARYVMKHGTKNLGLITTDAYRIGGHEQLRIYGKILGVMVHAVKDEADLKIALNELKNKHTILIDTVGVSQRDRMVAEQIGMLSNANTPIKKLLCLNATNTGETLTDVIRAYKGKGLAGCIMTKLDEAATIGNALDVIIREKLKLYYVANGQRVPEDIHLANKQYLIQHSLKLGSAGNPTFQFLNEELPFVMGNTINAANTSQLSGISYA